MDIHTVQVKYSSTKISPNILSLLYTNIIKYIILMAWNKTWPSPKCDVSPPPPNFNYMYKEFCLANLSFHEIKATL